LTVLHFHLGELMSFRDLNLKGLWTSLKKDSGFMKYFPDSCHKRMPSKDYFWKVYYYTKKDNFKQLIGEKISILKKKNCIKSDAIKVTDEAYEIFKNFKFEENLGLLGMTN